VSHRRVRQTLAERGFNIEANFASSFLRALESGWVSDTDTIVKAACGIA